MTRKDYIEKKWLQLSNDYAPGQPLCAFINNYCPELRDGWEQVWHVEHCYLSVYFSQEQESSYTGYKTLDESLCDIVYLCRALSLCMLLDDNEELLR